MLHIKFKYSDALSNWEWRTQECTVSSVEECKRIYGLDNGDVEYEILEVKEIKNMIKYKVHFSGYYGYDIEVEAEDENEAREREEQINDCMTTEEFNEICKYEPEGTDVWEVNK